MTKTTTTAADFVATYTSADGVRKTAKFKTLDGLRGFVHKWAGTDAECHGKSAVSTDGIGRVTWTGPASGAEVFAAAKPKADAKPARVKASPAHNATKPAAGPRDAIRGLGAALRAVDKSTTLTPAPAATDTAGPALVRLPSGKVSATEAPAPAPAPAISAAAAAVGLPAPAKAPKDDKPVALGPLEAVELPAYILAAALHAAAKGDVRFYLNGVHISEKAPGVLRVSASDGCVAFVHEYLVEACPSWAKGGGVIIDRERLAPALKLAGKDEDAMLSLAYGKHHPRMTITTAPEAWATVSVGLLDGKFPDLDRIAEGAASALSHNGVTPLQTAGLDPKLVKIATTIAATLDTDTVQPFIGDGSGAAVFTFGAVRAVLYVMPMRERGEVAPVAAQILAPAMARSLAALKAHETRTLTAAKAAKGDEAKALTERAAGFAERIKSLMQAANVKALPAPAKA